MGSSRTNYPSGSTRPFSGRAGCLTPYYPKVVAMQTRIGNQRCPSSIRLGTSAGVTTVNSTTYKLTRNGCTFPMQVSAPNKVSEHIYWMYRLAKLRVMSSSIAQPMRHVCVLLLTVTPHFSLVYVGSYDEPQINESEPIGIGGFSISIFTRLGVLVCTACRHISSA